MSYTNETTVDHQQYDDATPSQMRHLLSSLGGCRGCLITNVHDDGESVVYHAGVDGTLWIEIYRPDCWYHLFTTLPKAQQIMDRALAPINGVTVDKVITEIDTGWNR